MTSLSVDHLLIHNLTLRLARFLMSQPYRPLRRVFRSVIAMTLLAAMGCSQAEPEKTPEDIEKISKQLQSRSSREYSESK